MIQNAYDKKKIYGISVRVSVVTFLSLASMSSDMCSNSYTNGVNNEYAYDGISFVNDKDGEMCISSTLSDMCRGDVIKSFEGIEFKQKRNRRAVEIQVTRVSKHISRFDFEDEYEEI